MDGRKVSSLSTLSDGSDSSLNTGVNLVLEEIGQISVSEAVSPKSVRSSGNYISILSEETQVFLAEVRLRADSDCLASRYSFLDLPGIEDKKRYLDITVLATSPADVRLALLGERKNKERFVCIVEVITSGRSLSLGKELAMYDKASMLGKGLTHIVSCNWTGQVGEGDVFVVGNILRKMKVEDNGSVLKPTSGRVPIPPECMDGTISICVATSANKKGFSVISSFRTKSAGKNKYQINWFQGRNDEISVPAGKSSLKLSEEQEPAVILADPRDARAIYLICNSGSDQSAGLYKLVRGRKLEEPIFTFPFQVSEAVFVAGADKNLFLLVLESSSLNLKVFHLMKTEGFRGQQAAWSACNELQGIVPSFHAVSCAQHRWQLQPALADIVLSNHCPYQLALATLLTGNGEIATEPESGFQFRLRVMGGDQQNDVILIVLDDLERSFESEEDALSSMTLKMCMNSSPGREGMSQLSAWLMAGRLASVEIQCTRLENECISGSDRMVVQTVSTDTVRSFLVDQDWSQRTKREGTFVLDSPEGSPTTPSSIRTSTPLKKPSLEPQSRSSSRTRISSSKMAMSPMHDASHTNGNGTLASEDLLAAICQVEETISPLARANCQIRDSLATLERNLLLLKNASANCTEISIGE
eukprot:TRINITY_DN20053_c0_g1_i1.p1 TRINITY_DN20053_c0_g1~~TRINITY_DN20053_c0_g1_i1.p1  ORF type:complete len:645 (-),score=136.96 TRINITY_DN20053_c0_g1_i1:114-2048(-)